ncbi:MAG: META domain-containing protein [Variovorax sp.]|nr:MAG: META domain-containing protein [Variovorax sp.]
MRSFVRRAAFAALLVSGAMLIAGCSSVSLDEPIEGRTWRLARLGTEPVAPSGDPQRDAQLVFDGRTGRVSGSGGCNRLTAGYQRNADALKIGPLAATRMACVDAGRSALEGRFLAALQATASYRMAGDQLSLLDQGGQTLAVLSAVAR